MFTTDFLILRVIFTIIIVISVLIVPIRSECRQNNQFVQCDSFDDAKNSQEAKEEWQDLQIGHDTALPNTTYFLMAFPLYSFNNLRSLTIYNHLVELKTQIAFRCTHDNDLDTIIFHGNNLTRLKPLSIPIIKDLSRLSLAGNNIETVDPNAFIYQRIEFLDLSSNQIQIIQHRSIQPDNLRIVWLKHNKITSIDPGSFAPTLEYLNLNNNQLRSISSDILNELPNLLELSVSGNKFHTVPNIRTLLNVALFDFSHNEIESIPVNTFEKHRNLTFLDLGHNKLSNDEFVKTLLRNNNEELGINLGFNRFFDMTLTEDDLKDKSVTLWLFGNTWNCKQWEHKRAIVEKYQDQCDLAFFAMGSIPYCLVWDEVFYTAVSDEADVFVRELQRFFDKKKGKLPCRLTPNRLQFSNSVDFGCVA